MLNISVVRFFYKNVTKKVSERLKNAGRRKAKYLTEKDAEGGRRTDRRSHSHRFRGGRFHKSGPVGLDARLDLLRHRGSDLCHQPGLSETVEPRADPATHARL